MPPPPADSRVPHHMPVHANYPPPGPGYSSQPSHPMHHHPSARQHSTGPPPPPMAVGGPPPPLNVNGPPAGGMQMAGPPPDAGAVAPAPVSNGHAHGTPAPSSTRTAKEKQDSLLQQLANANENTWMLIGTGICLKGTFTLTCHRRRGRADERSEPGAGSV